MFCRRLNAAVAGVLATLLATLLAACASLPGKDWVPVAGRAPSGAQNLAGGTGFLAPGGGVVTAWHVVKGCKAIRVSAASGAFQAVSATVAALPTRPSLDLALLRLDPAPPNAVGVELHDIWPAAPAWTAAGEHGLVKPDLEGGAMVFGYPGASASMQPVVTPVSQLLATRLTNIAWQGDAYALFGEIARGDSGGPLIDRRGRVIGVVLAVAFHEELLQKNGIHGSVGFAAPAHDVVGFLNEAGVRLDPANGGAATSPEAFADNLVRIFCYR
ncbi:MAG TPA: serine protease [Stellaceae bacterium]|nr:serine protease [Stellaceae bacterium]